MLWLCEVVAHHQSLVAMLPEFVQWVASNGRNE
jgi:hypothetical protein